MIELLIIAGVITTGLLLAGALWANPRLTALERYQWAAVDAVATTVVCVAAIWIWRQR